MSRLIIVPLDGSGFAEEALPIAADLAAGGDGWLNLVMVHQPMVPLPGAEAGLADVAELDMQIREQEQAYLAQEADRIATGFKITATPVLLDGPVAHTLSEYVQSRKADFVVMSTHGRGGVSRFFLGSVADRLIRELHCPMLLVRPGKGATTVRRDERTRVLVPLDGSALAESAIPRVLSLLPPEKTVLELVSVLLPVARVLIPTLPAAPPAERASLRRDLLLANRYLAGVAGRLRKTGLRVHTEVLVEVNVARAVLGFAEERQCDLIALATRGFGGIERAVLGSVADKVIRGAMTPVLVWNPPAQPSGPVLAVVGGQSTQATTGALAAR